MASDRFFDRIGGRSSLPWRGLFHLLAAKATTPKVTRLENRCGCQASMPSGTDTAQPASADRSSSRCASRSQMSA